MKSVSFEKNLEGLRGFAALAVVWAHVFGFNNLLATKFHPDGYWAFINAGHVSVLIFFLLSGYVIGLTNSKESTISIAPSYLKKRAIRLYPIYILAICFSLLIVPENDIVKILGNLLFLQTLFVDLLKGNTILWTLNNEVIYYLLFLVLILLKPNYIILILSCIILLLILPLIPIQLELINHYLSGWIFWLIGLYSAWYLPKKEQQHERDNEGSYLIFPLILIMIATNLYSPGAMLNGFMQDKFNGFKIDIDLFLLPVTFSLFITIANRQIKYLKIYYIIAWLIPICVAIILFLKGRLFEIPSWQVAFAIIILSLILLIVKIKYPIMSKLAYMGSISFAIYVFHLPLLYLFNHVDIYNYTAFQFWARFMLFGIILFIICYLAEHKMQPYIKKLFYRA